MHYIPSTLCWNAGNLYEQHTCGTHQLLLKLAKSRKFKSLTTNGGARSDNRKCSELTLEISSDILYYHGWRVFDKNSEDMNQRMVLVLCWTLFELSVKNLKKIILPESSWQTCGTNWLKCKPVCKKAVKNCGISVLIVITLRLWWLFASWNNDFTFSLRNTWKFFDISGCRDSLLSLFLGISSLLRSSLFFVRFCLDSACVIWRIRTVAKINDCKSYFKWNYQPQRASY